MKRLILDGDTRITRDLGLQNLSLTLCYYTYLFSSFDCLYLSVIFVFLSLSTERWLPAVIYISSWISNENSRTEKLDIQATRLHIA